MPGFREDRTVSFAAQEDAAPVERKTPILCPEIAHTEGDGLFLPAKRRGKRMEISLVFIPAAYTVCKVKAAQPSTTSSVTGDSSSTT